MVALMILHTTNGSNHGAKDTITEWWVITVIGGPLSAGTSSLSTLSFWHDDWVVLFAIAFNDETKNEKPVVIFWNTAWIVPVIVLCGDCTVYQSPRTKCLGYFSHGTSAKTVVLLLVRAGPTFWSKNFYAYLWVCIRGYTNPILLRAGEWPLHCTFGGILG